MLPPSESMSRMIPAAPDFHAASICFVTHAATGDERLP